MPQDWSWLTTGLPLIIAAPVMAVMLNMDQDGFGTLMIAMLIGTLIGILMGRSRRLDMWLDGLLVLTASAQGLGQV